MPNIASAIKRMRSDATKRAKNQATLSELKTLDQKFRRLTTDPTKAKELAGQLISCYDSAVSRGVIPRGRADRKKSRIAKFLASIKK